MAGAIATVANVIGCYTTPILLKVFLANCEFEISDISSVSYFLKSPKKLSFTDY